VLELLRARSRRVRRLLVSSDPERNPILEEIVALAHGARVPVEHVDAERVRTEARNDAPQGVVAFADSIRPASLDDLLAEPNAFLVALDGVTDPRNLGAVLRSAEVAGATGAVVPRHRSAVLAPATVKAAAGAIERIPIASVSGIPTALDRARRADVWTIGLDAEGTTSVFDLDLADRPLVLVFGAEGAGLARLTRERCDVLVRIPMYGAIESLNVAAAAAVACFEIARRRAR
jgi:23S rRNA (guanosine2251-2'-O)-methyltransferase